MKKLLSIFVVILALVALFSSRNMPMSGLLSNCVESLCDSEGDESEYFDYSKVGTIKKEIMVQVGSEYNPETGQYEAQFEWRETILSRCVFSRKYKCAKALHNINC